MWSMYSREYIRQNRASSLSVMAAALISALFLSLLCGLFYNVWKYEAERIVLEEGDWQVRIFRELSEKEVEVVKGFANVEQAEARTLDTGEKAIELTFVRPGRIVRDMERIGERLGLEKEEIGFHRSLLSLYLVPGAGEAVPLLPALYIGAMAMTCLSLILIIQNAFAASVNARVFQLGIFSSVGATPRQIRLFLIQEAAVLCLVPVLAGIALGALGSFGALFAVEQMGKGLPGRHEAVFQYHPAVFLVSFLAAALTVFCSAWLPARKVSRITPLEAIRKGEIPGSARGAESRILKALFGIEGELAVGSLRFRRRALWTSTVSLTLAFLGYFVMTAAFSISQASVKETYYERYRDSWDVMVTVKDTRIQEFSWEKQGEACAVYQKASACLFLPKDWISREVLGLGGLEKVAVEAEPEEGGWLAKAPLIILDDVSFFDYCRQIGASGCLDGAVAVNQVWDDTNSNFREREYVPLVKEDRNRAVLRGREEDVEIPITAYTREMPILREETPDAMALVLPVSLWRQVGEKVGGAEEDLYIRVFAGEEAGLWELARLEEELAASLGGAYQTESENRIQEEMDNDQIIRVYQTVVSGFCVLLAFIGVANVFAGTMSALTQRGRELARYQSIGMTPAGFWRLFGAEAAVIVGRPFFFSLACAGLVSIVLIKASHLEVTNVLEAIPVFPALLFGGAVFGCVALAYFLGGRRVLRSDLAAGLRDGTAR